MRFHTAQDLKSFLNAQGLKPDKGLGQHFLCDPAVVEAIVNQTKGCKSVLEIGPGPGILTSAFDPKRLKVRAVEIDQTMLGALKISAPFAEIVHANAATTRWDPWLSDLPAPVAVVSNLPYYITAPLLQRAAEASSCFSLGVFMMQKEVAEKIVAPAGDRRRGSFSIFLQSRFTIATVCAAPHHCFWPAPKVDSTVLSFIPKGDAVTDKSLERLIRAGFAAPRKTLTNNLTGAKETTKERLLDALSSMGLSSTVRPHEIEYSCWIELWQTLKAEDQDS